MTHHDPRPTPHALFSPARWAFNELLIDVMPSMKAENEFTITTKKDKDSKKTVSVTFSTLHRLDLLSALQVRQL